MSKVYRCRVCGKSVAALAAHIAGEHRDLLDSRSRRQVASLFRCSRECAGKAFSIAGIRGLEPFHCPRCGMEDKAAMGEHVLRCHFAEVAVAIRSGMTAKDAANWLFAGSPSKGRMTEIIREVRTMLDDEGDDYPDVIPLTYDITADGRIVFRHPHVDEKCVALLIDVDTLCDWMDRVIAEQEGCIE